MKSKLLFYCCVCVWAAVCFSSIGYAAGNTLFESRSILLSKDDNRVFSIGITGTTAGYNYLALIENAKQESISLGELGYWERVPDAQSYLRNYDLQLIIENNYDGNFLIEFEYDKNREDIIYRIKKGTVAVVLDNRDYYPTLIINGTASRGNYDEIPIKSGSKRVFFFDFNSFDVDLRKYYGHVKRLMSNKDFLHYFYYYESGNYNSYYFKTYNSVGKLDTDKMGLSLENGTLEYYQKVLDDLKSRFGSEFAGQIIIVSRFGKRFSPDLKKYANDIGISREMVVTFISYEDID